MDYKEKYEQALERMKIWMSEDTPDEFFDNHEVHTFVFPELKDSEDERIRKALLEYFGEQCDMSDWNGVYGYEVYAWLEKQGEQKLPIEKLPSEIKSIGESIGFTTQEECDKYNQMVTDLIMSDDDNGEQKPTDNIEPKFKVGDWIERKDGLGCHAKIIFVGENVYGCEKLIHSEDESPFFEFMFKNQDEFQLSSDFKQKSADKVEPKFKVGDWVVQENIGVYKVIEVCESWYEVVDNKDKHYSIGFDKEYMCHLYTIQDAKDGDVLACNDNPFLFLKYEKDEYGLVCCSYCGISNSEYDEFAVNTNTKKYWCDIEFVNPATKEQRDLLFQKMHEAGYEWDEEKKEPKKIEQKPTDEEMKELLRTEYEKGRADAIAEIQNPAWSEEDECYMSECIGAIATKDGWSFEEKRKTKHWLKSLKDRALPQPKQEWSALDERNLQGVIDEIQANKNNAPNYDLETYDRFLSWLKSLKDRVQSKPILRRTHTIFDQII